MDIVQKTPNAETLRQMPYTDLRKLARKSGIKGNLKAEKLIAALTSMDSDDTDSFSTPSAQLLNASQKKKVEKFDEDSKTPLVTPRRGTYSIGSPIALKQNELLSSVVVNDSSSPAPDVSCIKRDRKSEKKRHQQDELSSPVANDASVLDMSNVIVGRGSERKLRNHKHNETSSSSVANELSVLDISNVTTSVANESSVLDMSNVTVNRGSERKPRNRKVSFLSPVMTPHTPKNSNLKLRPKTPIGSRTPLAATISPSPMKELKVYLGERVDPSLHLTPSAEIFDESSSKLTRSFIDKSESKKKRLATPNFKKIHARAFEKMESIDDYQKRIVNSAKKMNVVNFKANKVTKAKSKIPGIGGIPFIPSISKSVTTKFNTSTLDKSKQVEERRNRVKRRESENVNTKKKTKFDLKASLSRKLGYKPYSGPLKPLTPSNLNTSSICDHKMKATPAKEPVNKVVTSNRMQSRSILKGVRTNKRFELQMKNRMMD